MSDPTADSDERAVTAMAAAADGGLAAAVDGRFVAATDEWCRLWDVDRDGVVGTAVTDTALGEVPDGPPEPGETVRVERRRPERDPEGERPPGAESGRDDSLVAAELYRPDPETRTLSVSAETTAVDGRTYTVYTARDVTDRVALERDRNVLDALFEHVPVYLYLKDREGRHVRVSANVWNPEEVLAKTDAEAYGDDMSGQSYEDDIRVVEEGEQIINQKEYNAERNHYMLSSKVPWRDETGEIQGLIGVTRNVTERERRRQQLEEQNERLRTVASVISHDVRNPLQVAQGRLALAREERDSENLAQSAEALDRMNTLLEDLLALVRHGQWIDETELVSMQSAAGAVWETAAPETATLGFDQEFFFYADEARLQELLENLFRNAVVHGGPDVHVQVGPTNDWAGFYVEDDGPGIPQADRDRVFDSGYTTAEAGTGFGLAIVDVIADAHGWDARLTESESGGVSDEHSESEARETVSPGARFEFIGVEFE